MLVAWYGYDPWNRRVVKMLPEETKWYTWDGWQNVDEYDGAFPPRVVHFDGAGIDEHLAYARLEGSTWRRYTLVQGHLDTVMKVVNEQGEEVERYEYDSYGRRYIYDAGGGPLPESQAGNPYGFTGRRHDPETGLLILRNRYYSPDLGRFLTYDPIGIWGDGFNWGNGFGYCWDKPVLGVDPYGLDPGKGAGVLLVAAGIVVGALAAPVASVGTAVAVSAGAILGVGGTLLWGWEDVMDLEHEFFKNYGPMDPGLIRSHKIEDEYINKGKIPPVGAYVILDCPCKV